MKRFLKKDRFQLTLHEQEQVWRNIQAETGRGTARRPRRFVLPAFGMTAVTAAALLLGVWLHDKDAPEKIARQVRESAVPQEVPVAQTHLDRPEEAGPEVPEVVSVDKGKPDGTLSEAAVQVAPVRTGEDQPEPVKSADRDKGQAPPPAVEPSSDEAATSAAARPQAETFDKFAVETVEKALEKQAGVQMREGELEVRGGRSGQMQNEGEIQDTLMSLDSAVQAVPDASGKRALALARQVAPVTEGVSGLGSVTGGTTPPNGETFELMYFEHTGVNPFVATEEDALSTFAVDVDNASYTLTRSYLQRGALPPRDAIRVEEFVNFFGGGYPEQTDRVFAIHTDGADSRFGQGYKLLRVGLKGMQVAAENRKPANLIFVIDISGSMGRENRLGLVKQSLHVLLDELREGDRVGIVVYGSRGEVRLDPVGIEQRERIRAAIDGLQTGGATNACEGLEKAYELARNHYEAGLINRIILCSDGVANMGGTTRAEEMLATVRRSTDRGITLSTVGFGMGNYNDVLMEKLADQGDGNYHYVDRLEEAERVMRENLTGLLQTIARQVKIQVEFNPERVQRWRLLGYENRDVADRDFRNDAVDAGEVGAGHEVTALYELKLADTARIMPLNLTEDVGNPSSRLGTVRVRYEHPAHDTARAGQVEEIEHAMDGSLLDGDFASTPARLRLQAVAAEFAEILRGSYWARESRLADLVPVADAVARDLDGNGKTRELADLIRRAAELDAEREAAGRQQD